jgi:hypothetical protein
MRTNEVLLITILVLVIIVLVFVIYEIYLIHKDQKNMRHYAGRQGRHKKNLIPSPPKQCANENTPPEDTLAAQFAGETAAVYRYGNKHGDYSDYVKDTLVESSVVETQREYVKQLGTSKTHKPDPFDIADFAPSSGYMTGQRPAPPKRGMLATIGELDVL